MNPADLKRADAEQLEHRARILADGYQRARLQLASRIAAGMCANPSTYDMQSWEAQVAVSSVRVADKLLTLVVTGGL